MQRETVTVNEHPALILALIIVAKGHIDEREIESLERRSAFERLGVSRDRFLQLVDHCTRGLGLQLSECSWLRTEDLDCIDRLLDAVPDPEQRVLVCRLADAVLPDTCPPTDESRLVFEHALARWHIGDVRAGAGQARHPGS